MIEKKISRFMGLAMGITMSITMSIVGSFLGSVFFSYIVPKLMSHGAMDRPFISVIPGWLGSLAVSLVISMIIAIALGFIVPMKKINDAVENKRGKKGFVTHVIQSLISDLIYTTIISCAMAFVMAPLFSVPGQIKSIEGEIAGKNGAIAELNGQIAQAEAGLDGAMASGDKDAVKALTGQIEGLNGAIKGIEGEIAQAEAKKANIKVVPTALKNFATSYPIELLIALIVIIIVEPIFQKIAFKKYIPGYGKKVSGDEDI